MSEIHRTTLTPGKLELLAGWLPTQPWYRSTGRPPELSRAGGFRLDDPAGEVGIEFLFVSDADGTTYSVPLSYHGAPMEGAEAALVGTSEHGVLGRRWVYDGARDPVLVAQLLGCISGGVQAQHQSESHTPDPSVTRHDGVPGVAETADWTTVPVDLHGGGEHQLQLARVLDGTPGHGDRPDPATRYLAADVRLPDGTTSHRPVAVVRSATAG